MSWPFKGHVSTELDRQVSKLNEVSEHAAGLFVITPDGRVSRYLYGASHQPRTMRFALLEASNGRIGSTLDRFILWCHVYDPDSRSYVLLAARLMQLGGVITLLVLGIGLGWLWRSDRKRGQVSDAKKAYASRDLVQGVDR